MNSTLNTIRKLVLHALLRRVPEARENTAQFEDEALFQYVDKKHTIFVGVLDISRENLAEIIAKCSKRHGNGKRIIFLTNNPDFTLLRESSSLFEYFPSADTISRFGGTRKWPAYLRDRLELLSEKWRPGWRIDYGTSFEDYVESVERVMK